MSVAVAEPAAGLPRYLSRFVGRTAELAALRRQVLRSSGRAWPQRLTVLVGPGGIGKTRLAAEVASRLVGEPVPHTGFRHGAWWVDCVPVAGSEALVASIARSAGLPSPAGAEPGVALGGLLRERHALLVLDNAEHLTAAIQQLAAEILPRCPGLAMLVTSRTSLQCGTETTLGPLDSADRDDASELFYDRAGYAAPGFRAEALDATLVAAICRQVGGMPLAIELAAPWVRTLSTHDLHRRLAHSLDLLRTSDPELTPRHRAMRAVLEGTWSWLTAGEQLVASRLGIFVGGFGLRGAEKVAGADVSVLAALTAAGVIRRVPQPDGDTWFVMHELLRQFASERLATRPPSETIALRERQLRQLIRCAEDFERARMGPEADLWLARLAREQPNADDALDWGLHHRSTTLVLELLANSSNIWVYAGDALQQHGEMIYAALELPPEPGPASLVARRRVAYMAGWARFGQGEVGAARRLFRETLSLSRSPAETRDEDLEAVCLRALSRLAIEDGDPRTAERYARASLLICERAGLELAVAWTYAHLAEAAFAADDLGRTEAHLVRSAEIFRRLGDRFGEAMICTDLADLRRRLGKSIEALDAYALAVAAARGSSATTVHRNLLRGVAAAAAVAGLDEQAAELFGASDTWALVHGAWRDVISTAPEIERAACSNRLGEAAWASAHRRGRELQPDRTMIMAEQTILACRSALDPPAGLTAREREVLERVADGLSNHEIAARMELSVRTVHAHLRSIFRKLEVTSRTAALHEAQRLGVGSVPRGS